VPDFKDGFPSYQEAEERAMVLMELGGGVEVEVADNPESLIDRAQVVKGAEIKETEFEFRDWARRW
jgi:hypothetical protein